MPIKRKWKKERVGITLAQEVAILARETQQPKRKVYEAIGKQIKMKRRIKPRLADWEFKI